MADALKGTTNLALLNLYAKARQTVLDHADTGDGAVHSGDTTFLPPHQTIAADELAIYNRTLGPGHATIQEATIAPDSAHIVVREDHTTHLGVPIGPSVYGGTGTVSTDIDSHMTIEFRLRPPAGPSDPSRLVAFLMEDTGVTLAGASRVGMPARNLTIPLDLSELDAE